MKPSNVFFNCEAMVNSQATNTTFKNGHIKQHSSISIHSKTKRNFPPRFHDTQFLCEGLTRFLSRAGTFKINCAEWQQINSDNAHLAPPWSNKLVELATIGLWIKNLLSERKSTPRTSTLQIQMCCFLRRDRMHVPGNCSTEEPFVNELIVNATARPFRSSKLAVDVTCGVPNDR